MFNKIHIELSYVPDAVVFSILTHLIITTALDKVLSLLHFVDKKSEVYTPVKWFAWPGEKQQQWQGEQQEVDAGSLS